MTYGICSCGVQGYLVEYPFPNLNGAFEMMCPNCWEDHYVFDSYYDYFDSLEALNDVAWLNSETHLRLRTGKCSMLEREGSALFKARMKRIQAKKVRRMGKEMIREQLAASRFNALHHSTHLPKTDG